MTRWMAFALFVVCASSARAADPQNAAWSLTLEDAVAAGTSLVLEMRTNYGVLATVSAPAALRSAVDATRLRVEGGRARGEVVVTVNKVATSFVLDATVHGDKVAGKWTSGEGEVAKTGTVSGTLGELPARTPKLVLVKASCYGTAEDDDLQGAAKGPDGSIYLAGNMGMPLAGGNVWGADFTPTKCGMGTVVRLSADASKTLAAAQFARGIAMVTNVLATEDGVYVSGYATAGLEPLIDGKGGVLSAYPLREEVKVVEEGRIAEFTGDPGGEEYVAKCPGLGRYGAPFVVKMSADLARMEGGSYLEGWEQVWRKDRRFVKPFKDGFTEYCWQPICLDVAPGGDVVVAHDGGYFRFLTKKDRDYAATLGDAAKAAEILKRLCFYDVPDHVSRLSSDLKSRKWRRDIYTPVVAKENVEAAKPGWPLTHYSNPRTLRMRTDGKGSVYVAGWSASATSSEPWWTPYLWKLAAETGETLWKAYAWDPMSGGGHRMGGQVADTALATVAVEDDGNLLTALHSDGGNNAMGGGPRGHEGIKPTIEIKGGGYAGGLVHFNGHVQRVDKETRDGLGGSRTGHSAWAIDVAPMKDGYSMAVGRWNVMGGWSPDAWFGSASGGPAQNPNAFLRLYAPDFTDLYTTAVPSIFPFEASRLGPMTYIVTARVDKLPAAEKDGLMGPQGKSDGYFLIVEARP